MFLNRTHIWPTFLVSNPSMTMVELENPAKAALMSAIPKITSRRQASRGTDPKGSLSIMIRMIIKMVMPSAIIIWVVI